MSDERQLIDMLREVVSRNYDNINEISRFIGVSRGAILNWFKGSPASGGVPFVRLRFLLNALGYEIPIFRERKYKYAKMATEILCSSLESDIAGLAIQFGYLDSDSFLRVCQGKRQPNKIRAAKIATAHNLNQTNINSTRSTILEVLFGQGDGAPKSQSQNSKAGIQLSKDQMIQIAGYSIMSLLPLLEVIASDVFSDGDRIEFREKVGRDVVNRFTDLSLSLSGRSVRKQILGG